MTKGRHAMEKEINAEVTGVFPHKVKIEVKSVHRFPPTQLPKCLLGENVNQIMK